MSTSLEGKIALITGASRGIGRAVAKRFAEEGAHIVITARTVGALEELDDEVREYGVQATIVPLDMAEHDKIDSLGTAIAEKFGKLDILVANAAILGSLTPLSHLTTKIWQQILNINVTANWRLLRVCDPLLKRAEAGRAMYVTSGVTQLHPAYWGAYTMSKAALEGMIKTYAAELEETNVRVNLIDPGVVATNMRKEAFPGENSDALASPDSIAESFVKLALPSCQKHGEIVHV